MSNLQVVVCAAVRTAIGSYAGTLKGAHGHPNGATGARSGDRSRVGSMNRS